MKQYVDLIRHVLATGVKTESRSGNTISTFGTRMEFDLSEGFPLVSCKYTRFAAVAEELRWFLSGSTNIKDLRSSIWNEWATEGGDLGPVYGEQWRNWDGSGIDQIHELIETLKRDRTSRRMLVSAWNPKVLPLSGFSPQANVVMGRQALAPCHTLFQVWAIDGRVNLQIYQRSADVGLGVPFNVASYALTTHFLAEVSGLGVGKLVWVGGDTHIYENHVEALKGLAELPLRGMPTLSRNPLSSDPWNPGEYWELKNYNPGPKIFLPVSV